MFLREVNQIKYLFNQLSQKSPYILTNDEISVNSLGEFKNQFDETFKKNEFKS